MHRTCALFLGVLLAGCSANHLSQEPIPSAKIALAPSATIALVRFKVSQSATPLPTTSLPTTPPLQPVAPLATTTPADPLEQYRRWMDEARALHPYSESVDSMWSVMMCESSGNPDAVGAGIYHGLFQYTEQTWSGDWNPYRDRPIFDPQAQIFATAKAWQEGYQSWWGCYGSSV